MVRMVVMDHDEREVTLEPRINGAHGFDEIAFVGDLEQVRDHFRVGLGRERVAACNELFAQLAVVLDDSVQHDRHLVVVARRQRVRVQFSHRAVRRPACVSEAGRRNRAVRAGLRLQVGDFPDGTNVLEAPLFEECDPGGVVPAVLEALEPCKQERLRCPIPDISDDPAHPEPPFLTGPIDRGAAPKGACPRSSPRKRKKPGCGPVPSSETVSRALVERALRC